MIELLDGSFDLLLILDEKERVRHLSSGMANECGCTQPERDGCTELSDLFNAEALTAFREAMPKAASGERGVVVYWKPDSTRPLVVFKSDFAETEDGPLYFFRSNRSTDIADFRLKDDREKMLRAKELACLYSVAEWVQESKGIDEFFTDFPKYMATGMQYPDQVRIWSVYQGQEYGEKPEGGNILTSALSVRGETLGEIVIGYDDPDIEPLHEEQKLLDEIARFLCLALDRKSLAKTVEVTSEELEEVAKKVSTLEFQIEARTRELDKEHKTLAKVNSYLDQAHRGFDESKRTLKTMFQAIPDTVALIDKDLEVVMTNQSEKMAGQACHKALFDLDTPCLDCRLIKISETRAPVTVEAKHGDRFFEVHALPVFNEDHEVDGIIEFFRDITYRKVYEQQLQQADKLASLGQLVSGIGHEINNPNQFIRGNIKIIKQALDDILPIVDEYQKDHPDLKIARLKYDFFRQHVQTLVDDMANGSERIKRIVQSLKSFARKDEGLLADTVDINNVIDESARLVHNQVHKSADIQLNLAPDLPTFEGNAQKLEQVIINLIINASQAMPADQRGLIRVSSEMDGGHIVARVADNGSGMSPSTAKNIFDPFFTTKRARGGTGLGLSIAHRIIEEHQGMISVDSEIGVGTTFTIRLPTEAGSEGAGREDS
ncbi:MAG: ATP-binding protein [Acidobacteriota bacterium]